MGQYHPMYGQLLTSREASDLTGFTMNQLRYFRQNPDKSPFPLLKMGATTLYRESDVKEYIAQNGTIGVEYIVPEGAIATPLTNPNYDATKKDAYEKLGKITTRNAWSKVQEQLTIPDPGFGFPFLEKEMVRLYELKTGVNILEEYPKGDFVGALDYFLRKNHPNVFWEARTYAVRSLARHTYKWDVTDDDIISVPIGDVPPAKID